MWKILLFIAAVFAWPGSAQGQNIALNKPANQTSTARNAPAGLAVDGNLNTDFSAGSCSLTSTEDNPSWWVDLGQTHIIDSDDDNDDSDGDDGDNGDDNGDGDNGDDDDDNGYGDDDNDEDVDYCHPNPCDHGLVCQNAGDHYHCGQPSQHGRGLPYKCSSDSCLHGMYCISEGVESYSCKPE
uniref:EGF-like domain-containing protein n=1 Tax=Branchiostoma floridae TaxID=7739 RepID=C3ZDI5_BRAFL|eukprot:XP_002592780.1 hypothetical protein BRAFLDRAFT_65360 [Branchiostoma floridae]